jgi:hypothetical protein
LVEREAVELYKMDVGAITTKIKKELSIKDNAMAAKSAKMLMAA